MEADESSEIWLPALSYPPWNIYPGKTCIKKMKHISLNDRCDLEKNEGRHRSCVARADLLSSGN